jgi:hypothetical protein
MRRAGVQPESQMRCICASRVLRSGLIGRGSDPFEAMRGTTRRANTNNPST